MESITYDIIQSYTMYQIGGAPSKNGGARSNKGGARSKTRLGEGSRQKWASAGELPLKDEARLIK